MHNIFKKMAPCFCICAVFAMFGIFASSASAQTTTGTETQISIVKGTYTQEPDSSVKKYSSNYAEVSFYRSTKNTDGYSKSSNYDSTTNGGIKGVSFNASKNILTLKNVKATTLSVSYYYSYAYGDTTSDYKARTLYLKLVGKNSLRSLSIATFCKVVFCGTGSLTLDCSKDLGENVYPKSTAALASSSSAGGNVGTFSLKIPAKVISGGSLYNNHLIGSNVRKSFVGTSSVPSKKVVIGHAHKYKNGICKICGETKSKSKVSGVKLANVGKGKLKVSWKKKSGAKGYQVAYKVAGSKWKNVSVSSKSKSKVISKLKSGKKTNVKVRQYIKVSGKKFYGAWSSAKTKKVK